MEHYILEVLDTINKVYPKIAKDYKCDAEVEVYTNIYNRLKAISVMEEDESYAEYSWSQNKIYLYTDYLETKEDIIRSLIHECVHSNQCHDEYEAYYDECDLDYDTHPHEIEAEYEEEKWRNYEIKY